MKERFLDFARGGLKKARQMGADSAELFVMKNRTMEMEMKEERIESLKQSDARGVGLRVIRGKRQGFAYSADFRSSALEQMLQQALENSRYSDLEPLLRFPAPEGGYPKLELSDPALAEHTLSEKQELAQETARQALRAEHVGRVERSGYEEGEVHIWLANTNGLLLHQSGTYCGLFCLALGEKDGEQQSGYGMDSRVRFAELSPRSAGQMAARRAVELLGARQIASGRMDLVLEPLVAAQIFGLLSGCFSGEAVQKQKTFLAGKMGEQVASKTLTLVDDGTLENRLGSASFDGEGTPSQRTVLLQDGVLQNYLYDALSAAKAGARSTGNGMRGSYQGTPHVGTSNYYLEPGGQTPEELIGAVERGLYVTEILGAHTANPVSGDFSLGASGLLIEHGRLSRPVRGVTIAGNFRQFLQNIGGVGKDLTFFGGQGAPTLLVRDIMLSGT